jgi:ferredoxin
MRLAIDWTAGDGRGLCLELLPEALRPDDWGYPVIDPGPLAAALTGPARRAVAACPRRGPPGDPAVGPGRSGRSRLLMDAAG